MGYHKNQLIASQVEVGDRVPEPKPWHSHASLSRRTARELRKATARQYRSDIYYAAGMFGLGAFTVAAMWFLTEVAI